MATLLGALWGLGHSTGQLILGLAMIALKDRFDQLVPMLSRWGGTTVGLTLLWIGLMGLYEGLHEDPQTMEISETVPTLELQTQVATAGPGPSATVSQRQGPGWFTFITGVVYGLQPDALFVIVPALALPTKAAAAAYILMFVIGTVTAMGGYTAVIGATSRAVRQRSAGITSHLSTIASSVAVLVGASILASCWGVHIPIISSLFG
ncbi:hypothetical protein WJX84_010966 [Apatococcus fuscideae]|uniref:Nickel/cobalt efflux system n=1 Tax=Apatococcus fuscideae TaxID=2026836 RepID=A0AAW1RUK6_9CHLO